MLLLLVENLNRSLFGNEWVDCFCFVCLWLSRILIGIVFVMEVYGKLEYNFR